MPEIDAEIIYPRLTPSKLESGYNKVKLNYFSTSINRLYKIDDGEWQEYQDKEIRLEIGNTIYAKSINKYDNESQILSYTSVLPSDALKEAAYDNNESTYLPTGTYKIIVDPSAIGKKINIRHNVATYYSSFSVGFYDKNNNNLKSVGLSGNGTSVQEIPSGTTTIIFNLSVSRPEGSTYYSRIHEVYLAT